MNKRNGWLRDRFRRKKKPVDKKPKYDLVGDDTHRDRRDQKQKERRNHIIDRKHAQADIAKHRKWVVMWVAIIVVAIVLLIIYIMSKFSLMGLLF